MSLYEYSHAYRTTCSPVPEKSINTVNLTSACKNNFFYFMSRNCCTHHGLELRYANREFIKKTESHFHLKLSHIVCLKALRAFSNRFKPVPLIILQRAAAEKNSCTCLFSLTQHLLIWVSLVS